MAKKQQELTSLDHLKALLAVRFLKWHWHRPFPDVWVLVPPDGAIFHKDSYIFKAKKGPYQVLRYFFKAEHLLDHLKRTRGIIVTPIPLDVKRPYTTTYRANVCCRRSKKPCLSYRNIKGTRQISNRDDCRVDAVGEAFGYFNQDVNEIKEGPLPPRMES